MMLNEDMFTEHKDWQYVTSKDVEDSDGFMTDYTWYKRITEDGEEHIFIFGDSDIYGPYDSVPDYETDSEERAREWFDSYNGFADELDEALYSRDFESFKKIADEIGLKTAEDLERFRKEEVREGESDLEAIKRYRAELGDDFKLKESLESECAKNNLIIDELSEEDIEGFGIEIINSYDNVAYYCVDTGNSEQVVVAFDLDSKRITIEEDTDGLGFGEGDEYKNAEAFMKDYIKYTNLTECLHTEVLTERYLSGRYVWCEYKDIEGMNIYQLCKHIEKLYKDKFGRDCKVTDAIDQSYDYSNKELPFIVEADLGDEESVKGCDGFWFIVNCTEDEANKLKGVDLKESVEGGETKYLYFFPHVGARQLTKEQALKMARDKLKLMEESSGAGEVGQGFAIYCIESTDDADTWTARNDAKEFIKSLTESFDVDKVQKRIASTSEFDNGYVFFDYEKMTSDEAEKKAKQMSIDDPTRVFYVKYDDIMNPSSDIFWKNGEQVDYRGRKLEQPAVSLQEGRMKELATEIENEGGKDKWLAEMSKRISEMRDMLSYLKTEAPKEVNKGGNFDSYEELAEAVADIEKELDELLVKVKAVA